MSRSREVTEKYNQIVQNLEIGDQLRVLEKRKKIAGQTFEPGEVLIVVNKYDLQKKRTIQRVIGLRTKGVDESFPEPGDTIATLEVLEVSLADKLSSLEVIKKRPIQ